MVKLRHINGPDLDDLERQLEKLELPIIIQQIQRVSSTWFIHFLIQGIPDEKLSVNKVKSEKTKTIRKE